MDNIKEIINLTLNKPSVSIRDIFNAARNHSLWSFMIPKRDSCKVLKEEKNLLQFYCCFRRISCKESKD